MMKEVAYEIIDNQQLPISNPALMQRTTINDDIPDDPIIRIKSTTYGDPSICLISLFSFREKYQDEE